MRAKEVSAGAVFLRGVACMVGHRVLLSASMACPGARGWRIVGSIKFCDTFGHQQILIFSPLFRQFSIGILNF
jgi:hypothetical protein